MDSPEDEWVFGPNPRLDNIYQNVPQVRCPVFFSAAFNTYLQGHAPRLR